MLVKGARLLQVARENGFAIPAFNISDWNMLQGLLRSAEKTNAPIILEIHPDELALMGPDFLASALAAAINADAPVGIHFDHGASIDDVIRAIRYGFTSAMFDGSMLPFEENVAISRKAVEAAHVVGVAVEAELGTIGAMDAYGEGGADTVIYTDPSDAKTFVERTGVDSLALAIGTYHGIYPPHIKPELKLDLLEEIASVVEIPLVLHGGSNNPDNEIAQAARMGISKINISSDVKVAYFNKMREVLKDENLREPHAIVPPCLVAMQAVAEHKIRLFNTAGKADLY